MPEITKVSSEAKIALIDLTAGAPIQRGALRYGRVLYIAEGDGKVHVSKDGVLFLLEKHMG